MRYDFDELHDRAERMQCITDHDFDRYFDLLCEWQDARREAAENILALVREHGCVALLPKDASRWYYAHNAPGLDGWVQVTSWDQYGPTGHYMVRNADEMVNNLPDAFDVRFDVAA